MRLRRAAVLAFALAVTSLPLAAQDDGSRDPALTDARITQFLEGLAAETRAAPTFEKEATARRAEAERKNDAAQQAHGRALADYNRKHDEWDACMQPIRAKLDADGERMQARAAVAQPTEAQLAKLQARMQAAAQAGDMATIQHLSDSLSKVGMATSQEVQASTTAAQTAAQGCGLEPERPSAPPTVTAGSQSLEELGAAASGLRDYHIVRERIEYFVAADAAKLAQAVKAGVFTQPEADLLHKRRAELQQALAANAAARQQQQG